MDKKKGLPLEPRYAGICKFTTKIFQTPTQKGGSYENIYIKIMKKPSEKRDPTNPFAVHLVNPLLGKASKNLGTLLPGTLHNFPGTISQLLLNL